MASIRRQENLTVGVLDKDVEPSSSWYAEGIRLSSHASNQLTRCQPSELHRIEISSIFYFGIAVLFSVALCPDTGGHPYRSATP